MRTIVAIFLFTSMVASMAGDVTINKNTRIVFDSANAIKSEQTAVKELETYLAGIIGSKIEVAATPAKKNIFLGFNTHAEKFFGKDFLKKLGEEEFVIRSDSSGNIYITGGRPRGTLYGVYWFLDRKMGVRWYTPDFERIPRSAEVCLSPLDIRQKPAFELRLSILSQVPGYEAWAARNLINSTYDKNPAKIDGTYGGNACFAFPYPCHTVPRMIPDSYFKTNPEWWALRKGKRAPLAISSDYCLTNKELLKTVIEKTRANLKKSPAAKYMAIMEGDSTKGACECPECSALLKKYGGKESGLWIYFTNQVANALKDEFPNIIFVTSGYIRTAQAPDNIRPADNVAVWLCAWMLWRGVPYDEPENIPGGIFVNNLKKWKAICDYLIIWDYIYAFGDTFMLVPDSLVDIDNLRMYKSMGVKGYFPENDRSSAANGMPFKAWMIARAMWEPDGLDGIALETEFCEAYYGKEAGKWIDAYLKNLRAVNSKQQFAKFTADSSLAKADFESYTTAMQSYRYFQDALKAAAGDELYLSRVKDAYLSLQNHFLRRWRAFEKQGPMPEPMEDFYKKAIAHAQFRAKGNDRSVKELCKKWEGIYSVLSVGDPEASVTYRGSPAEAYDGNINSYWHSGRSGGQYCWIQIDFRKPRELKRITSVFCSNYNGVSSRYRIEGSLDGKKWFVIVPERDCFIQDKACWLYGDDVLNVPVETRFVRTYRINTILQDKRRNDVQLYEQYFNLEKLPAVLTSEYKGILQ